MTTVPWPPEIALATPAGRDPQFKNHCTKWKWAVNGLIEMTPDDTKQPGHCFNNWDNIYIFNTKWG